MDGSGKDEAPSLEDTEITLKEVTRILREENPDCIVLTAGDLLLAAQDVHGKMT